MKNNYILIQDIKETQTASGLWLPEEKHNRVAKVLAVSSDDEEIEVGDTVLKLIGKGTIIRLNGTYVEAIHRNNLLAVIK